MIFGGEVIRIIQDVSNTKTQTGNFAFTGQYSGSNQVDFLLGAPATFTQGAGQYQNVRATVPSLFLQDNWRIGQKWLLRERRPQHAHRSRRYQLGFFDH